MGNDLEESKLMLINFTSEMLETNNEETKKQFRKIVAGYLETIESYAKIQVLKECMGTKRC